MGASDTHLLKFDMMPKLAERRNGDVFPAHQSPCAVSAVEFLCKLLNFCGRGPLQPFCSKFGLQF